MMKELSGVAFEDARSDGGVDAAGLDVRKPPIEVGSGVELRGMPGVRWWEVNGARFDGANTVLAFASCCPLKREVDPNADSNAESLRGSLNFPDVRDLSMRFEEQTGAIDCFAQVRHALIRAGA